MYKNVIFNSNSNERRYTDAESPNEWTVSRYKHMARLRQNALDEARTQGTDYLLVRGKFN